MIEITALQYKSIVLVLCEDEKAMTKKVFTCDLECYNSVCFITSRVVGITFLFNGSETIVLFYISLSLISEFISRIL